MFFEKAKDARIYANMQTLQTKHLHVVTKTRKYLCPPKEYFGRDYIVGFTVQLRRKQ